MERPPLRSKTARLDHRGQSQNDQEGNSSGIYRDLGVYMLALY
uniref:Uncharacterized protein n=1 Tax=Anguilla anguilla TaxID=7936 RepID=A0A0E9TM22_ANGAN